MSKTIIVKITKSNAKHSWYYNEIGSKFKVYSELKHTNTSLV